MNPLLEQFLSEGRDFLQGIGEKLLQPDGTISRETMGDFLHPTESGYAIGAQQ